MNIERLMDLSWVLMKRYTEDEKGELPVRYRSRKIIEIADKLLKDPSMSPRVVLLNGLRGVGKTTTLFQMMRSLEGNGVDRDDILYFSMDRASLSGLDIRDIIEMYENKVLRNHMASVDRTIFILIDEAHYSPKWDLQIKTLSDEAPNAVFIATGSSALEITTSADLSRRSLLRTIPPLSFIEYLEIKTRKEKTIKNNPKTFTSLFNKDNAESALETYENNVSDTRKVIRSLGGSSPGNLDYYVFHGGLPFSVNSMDPPQQIYEMVRKIIEKDVPLAGDHDTGTLRNIPRVLGIMSGSPDISLNSMARDIDGLSTTSVRALLDTLERTGLIFEVKKTGGTSNTLRSDTRKYFISSSITSAIQSSMGNDPRSAMGAIIETAAVSTIKRNLSENPAMNIKYMKGSGMADLILEYGDKNISVEIGSGKKVKGPRQLKKTIAKSGSDYGILVSSREEVEVAENILTIPIREFLSL